MSLEKRIDDMACVELVKLRIYWLGGSSEKDTGRISHLLLITRSLVFTLTNDLVPSFIFNYASENVRCEGGRVS